MLSIDFTEIEQFVRCPRRWAWGSSNGKGFGFYRETPIAKKAKDALVKALRVYATYASGPKALLHAQDTYGAEMYNMNRDSGWDEALDTGLGVLSHFHSVYPSLGVTLSASYNEFNVPMLFNLNLWPKTGTDIIGYADSLTKRDDQTYLVKFIVSSDHVQHHAWRWERWDDEMNITLAGARTESFFGPDFVAAGICYIYVRFKAPRVPERLKGGGFSKAKNIDTTYDVYMQALRNNELAYREDNKVFIAPEYLGILHDLQVKGNNFFHVQWHTPTEHCVQRTVRRTRAHSQAMWNKDLHMLHDDTDKTHCASCPFQAPCTAYETGEDWEFQLSQVSEQASDKLVHAIFDWS